MPPLPRRYVRRKTATLTVCIGHCLSALQVATESAPSPQDASAGILCFLACFAPLDFAFCRFQMFPCQRIEFGRHRTLIAQGGHASGVLRCDLCNRLCSACASDPLPHSRDSCRPIPGYFSFGESSGHVYECQPPGGPCCTASQHFAALSAFDWAVLRAAGRCLGSQYSLCGEGYTGDFCSACAPEYYTEGEQCMPCVPGETLRLYIALGMFLLVLNLFFFFAHPDLTICFLSSVGHLKSFRAVGLYFQLPYPVPNPHPAIRFDAFALLRFAQDGYESPAPSCKGKSHSHLFDTHASTDGT